MFRLLFIIAAAGLLYWAYQNGILRGLSNGFTPVVGQACRLKGPSSGHLFLADSEDSLAFLIRTAETKSLNRMEDSEKLANTLDSGRAMDLEGNPDAVILENGSADAGGVLYPAVRVRISGGDNEGQEGWVRRENVVDTPLQELFALFR